MRKNAMLIVVALGLGALIGTMNMTMFNVALPTIMEVFHTSLAEVQWLTSGYMLAAGMIIPAAGFLGDRIGYKKLFCGILAFLLILSVVGAFAWCIEFLIVIRFLFGMTGGLLQPLALAMMYRFLPASQQTMAVSIWSMVGMIGAILPTCLTGVILAVADWRFLLLFNVPLVIIAILVCLKTLPADQNTAETKLDFSGMFLTSMGSMLLLIAFSNIASWGVSVQLIISILAGLTLLAVYVGKSIHRDDAMLNLGVLKYRRYTAAYIASSINAVATYMIVFLMPLFLQSGLGVSPLATGLLMLPGSIVSLIVMPILGIVYPKLGEKLMALLGIVIIVLGSVPFMLAVPTTPVLFVVIGLCVRSVGLAALNLVAMNAQMSDIPPELSGHASSLTNWTHQMLNALTVGVASSIAAIFMAHQGMETADAAAWAYTSTMNLMISVACMLFVCVIPIALKFFRSKKEM